MKGLNFSITDFGVEVCITVSEVYTDKPDENLLTMKHVSNMEEAFEWVRDYERSD